MGGGGVLDLRQVSQVPALHLFFSKPRCCKVHRKWPDTVLLGK